MSNFGVPTTGPQSNQDVKDPDQVFKFEDEWSVFKNLLESHQTGEKQRVEQRRVLRKNRQNVDELRRRGELLPDETIIPDRTVEQNIQAEKPIFLQYVTQPTTVISFSDPAFPTQGFEPLEQYVTRLCRYPRWKLPWLKLIDELQTHGAGFLEVLLDDRQPNKFVIEYVRREHIIFPAKSTSLNSSARVAREYELTKQQFRQFVQLYGFDSTLSKTILEKQKNTDNFLYIYKVFLRHPTTNELYIAWQASCDHSPDRYLKAPEPYYLGDFTLDPISQLPSPVPTTKIGVFAFLYSLEEDEVILEVQGRVALDAPVQSAMTSLLSSTVNGAHRASQFFPTRKAQPGSPDSPSNQELFRLKHGHVFEGDFTTFQPAWPNQIALTVAQVLSVRSSQALGQTDFAAMSRNDTAKRAAEIYAAQEHANQLNAVKISLFSESSLAVYECCWNIIRNLMQIGVLPVPDTIQIAQINPFSPTLTLAMSADAQVVERQQLLNKYLQFLPVVQGTKFQEPIFKKLLQTAFPDEFPLWLQQVGNISAQEQMVAQLLDVINQLKISPAEAWDPMMLPQILQAINQAKQMVTPVAPDGTPTAGQIAPM